MIRPFIVRRLAESDLQAAAHWYEAERTGLGRRFLDDVDRTFKRIRDRPMLFPPVAEAILTRAATDIRALAPGAPSLERIASSLEDECHQYGVAMDTMARKSVGAGPRARPCGVRRFVGAGPRARPGRGGSIRHSSGPTRGSAPTAAPPRGLVASCPAAPRLQASKPPPHIGVSSSATARLIAERTVLRATEPEASASSPSI